MPFSAAPGTPPRELEPLHQIGPWRLQAVIGEQGLKLASRGRGYQEPLISLDGRWVLLSGLEQIGVWDVARGQLRQVLPKPKDITVSALSSDGRVGTSRV